MMAALNLPALHQQVLSEGVAYMLGTHHSALQSAFLNDIPTPWFDDLASQLGLHLDSSKSYRKLCDLWMIQKSSDAKCISQILPAIRDSNPALFDGLSDTQILNVWRGLFAPASDHIRNSQAPIEAPVMTTEAMTEVLCRHYGESSIKALIRANRLVLVRSAGELPLKVRIDASLNLNKIAAATTGDNSVYLIGNRATPETLPGLFLHEVGEHAALADMLGSDYGRLSKHFSELVHLKDTYAMRATLQVPANTPMQHVASEQLAYLIQNVANDTVAEQGGEAGFSLGQDCLATLRAWLFRTPLCRWLESQGQLDGFTLRPTDIAALAREAVDYFVSQNSHDSTPHTRSQWLDVLDHETLDDLHSASSAERIERIEAMKPLEKVGYLYALRATYADDIDSTISHFTLALEAFRDDADNRDVRTIAVDLLGTNIPLDRSRDKLKAWAGSTCVAEIDGTPKVVYHGTGSDITRFNPAMIGSGADNNRQATDAFWFTSSDQVAFMYANLTNSPSIMPVFLRIERPLTVHCADWAQRYDTLDEAFRFSDGDLAYNIRWFKNEAIQQARTLGHDGVVFVGGYDGRPEKGAIIYAAFEPSQIKSAIGNKGTYDSDTDDIRLSTSKATELPAFKSWFEGSILKSESGEPLVLYRGLGQAYDPAVRTAGMTWVTPDSQYAAVYATDNAKLQADDRQIHSVGANIVPVYASVRRAYDLGYRSTHERATYAEILERVALAVQNSFEREHITQDAAASLLREIEFSIASDNGEVKKVFEWWSSNASHLSRLLTRAGYDAIRSREGFDDRVVAYGVFNAGRIKSALSNVGTYSALETDIRLSYIEPKNTPAFEAWFNGSKVKTNDGEPLVVYHGTKTKGDAIEAFDISMCGSSTDSGWLGKGVYFGSSNTANAYSGHHEYDPEHFPQGGAIYPVYLSLKTPAVLIDTERNDGPRTMIRELLDLPDEAGADDVREGLIRAGYDGVIYERYSYTGKGYKEYVALHPTQIKSAISNIGTFDPANQDIRFSFAGQGAETADLNLLEQAKANIEAGHDADNVWRETGWYLGHDQAWRFEIDDSKATIEASWYIDGEANGKPVRRVDGWLGDHDIELHPIMAAKLGRTHKPAKGILKHPKLFEAYPQLRKLNVIIEESAGFASAENGLFRRDTVDGIANDSVLVRVNPEKGGRALGVLLHELQHAIQKIERFARGGSVGEFDHTQLVALETHRVNSRIREALKTNPETAKIYREYTQLRIQANDLGWPEQLMDDVAATEKALIAAPGGESLFDLESERFGIELIDVTALAFKHYKHLAGEVEARNVQTRQDYSLFERLTNSPASTEDTAPELITVRGQSCIGHTSLT